MLFAYCQKLSNAIKPYLKSFNSVLDSLGVLQTVKVLLNPLDHLKALEDVHDIVYPPPLYA